MCRPNGCRCTRTFLGAPPTPRFGVGEATMQTPGADMCRGNEEMCVLEIVRTGDGRFRICKKTGKYRDRTSQRTEQSNVDGSCHQLVMRGQKRVLKGVHARLRRAMDARERAYDPRIHLLRKKSLRRRMDCIATRACPSCAVLCAASRASPTCGVKPGNDSEGVVPARGTPRRSRRGDPVAGT